MDALESVGGLDLHLVEKNILVLWVTALPIVGAGQLQMWTPAVDAVPLLGAAGAHPEVTSIPSAPAAVGLLAPAGWISAAPPLLGGTTTTAQYAASPAALAHNAGTAL